MTRHPTSSDVSRAILAGAAAGLAAAYAMNAFQAVVGHLTPDTGPSNETDAPDAPATEQAADRLAAAGGTALSQADRKTAGNAVHYATGAILGAGYAVAVRYEPHVAAGRGTAFGLATAAVLDEAIVPAAGLSAAPWTFPATTHLYGLLSHLVFGITTDTVLRLTHRR